MHEQRPPENLQKQLGDWILEFVCSSAKRHQFNVRVFSGTGILRDYWRRSGSGLVSSSISRSCTGYISSCGPKSDVYGLWKRFWTRLKQDFDAGSLRKIASNFNRGLFLIDDKSLCFLNREAQHSASLPEQTESYSLKTCNAISDTKWQADKLV